MNAINYMMDFEQDGLHLYELLMCESTNAELRTIFTLLADSQREHLRKLMDLKEGMTYGVADSYLVERAEQVPNGFRKLLDAPDEHKALRYDPDALWHIVNAEEEHLRLMEGMAKSEEHEEVRELMHELVEDEKAHLEKIVSIYEFMQKPHTYLEWGEFSNMNPL